ncbi:ATPase, putative [Bodo saltans]|uniref:ATPase, putative n=1 Tax=Bodo saltans TaxID=75058 RepID=A0A0S4JCQ4_BODSA|nr:ATPase, putative [Bodo saltans]|eukprot:CUG88166.1 ATPase, putative [Bodo saltans]
MSNVVTCHSAPAAATYADVQCLLCTLLIARGSGPSVSSILVDGEAGNGKSYVINSAIRWTKDEIARARTTATACSSNTAAATTPSIVDHLVVLRPSATSVFSKRHKSTGRTALTALIEEAQEQYERKLGMLQQEQGAEGTFIATLCVVLDRFDMFLASNSVAILRGTADDGGGASQDDDDEADLHLLFPHFVAEFYDLTQRHPQRDKRTALSPSISWRVVYVVTTNPTASPTTVFFLLYSIGSTMFLASNSVAILRGTADDGGGASQDDDEVSSDLHLLFPHFVAEFYDLTQRHPQRDKRTALSPLISWRVVYVVTTSPTASPTTASADDSAGGGAASSAVPLLHPLLRRRLFRWHVSIPSATEVERGRFFLSRLKPSAASLHVGEENDEWLKGASEALAARSGGLTFAGLTEVWDAFRHVVLLSNKFRDQRAAKEQTKTSHHNNAPHHRTWLIICAEKAMTRFYHSASPQSTAAKRRVGYVDVVKTRWSDIAGLRDVKEQLKRMCASQHDPAAAAKPLRIWQRLAQSSLVPPTLGVVLHGPPGTGKTMLAKAMACELSASFIFLDLPQLIHGEVGESEVTMRRFFHAAQQRSPCVMFMDEVQAAFGRRDNAAASGGSHDARLVSCFLSLLDEACIAHRTNGSPKVWFVCATNAIHLLDPLILRAGRLDQHLYVGNPDEEAREHLVRHVVYSEWAAWWELTPTASAAEIAQQQQQPQGDLLTFAFVSRSKGMSGAELRSALNVFALTLATTAPSSQSGHVDNDSTTPLAFSHRLKISRLFTSSGGQFSDDCLKALEASFGAA